MKREGYLFEHIADFWALSASARRAARGKAKTRPSAASFLFHMEGEVLQLERELKDGTYKPRPFRTFYISDPKPRTISAADFRDRVVHHALCAALEPLFERVAIDDNYACRPGKGSHAAAVRARYFARRSAYFLKLDIRKFFETLDHGVLKSGLKRLVKDNRVLDLADRIIDHGAPGSPSGRGLPIGNLTSQHFANFYLAPLDHFIKRELRISGYVRYMDDFLMFSDSKEFLSGAHGRIRDYLGEKLILKIKEEASVFAPVSEGIPFLGLRIWPGLIRLDGSGKRRFIRALRAGVKAAALGRISEEELADSLRSRLGHAAHADTLGLLRSLSGLMDLGSQALRAPTALFAGAPGTTMPGTCVRPIATTTGRATATAMLGFAS